ncbi:MAG TPA: DNA polymerase Y family protein [Steroidobacteraceae bacterium]|nr:DNA polymerase Y family protein [Steroidobacteraceae bacterium]
MPRLPLAALQTTAGAAPLVVTDAEDRNQRILCADPRAEAAGVHEGMTLGAALAILPDIDPRPRDSQAELALMRRLAGLAAVFTPQVSIESPDGLLLEIKPSIRLFGGLRELCRKLRAACLADPVFARPELQPCFTLAPTALAALAAARAGARCFITDPAVLPARLKPLPVSVLRWPAEENQRLAAMGVHTLGELLRLPRAGFARRFGPAQLADLDRLLGRRADPRARLHRRERYRGRVDLDHELEDHERIIEVLRPLLEELEQFLGERQRGITALQCRFHHYRAAPTVCALRLAAPEASAVRLLSLLRERLATLELPEPVRRCELRGGALSERPLASKPLWSAGEHGHAPAGEMPALVEHLRARLGNASVHGLRRVSEHRPENAWQVAEPALCAAKKGTKKGTDLFIDNCCDKDRAGAGSINRSVPFFSPFFTRPLWLLATPEPLSQQRGWPRRRGPLEILQGPERIESGWWDGADVVRDYYVARDSKGSLLWLYCECSGEGGRRWFVHGLFG